MSRRRRLDGARGFTLLEVLVAVAVLSVAVVTLLGLQARNVKIAAETRDLTIASLLASSLAAEVKAGPFPEQGSIEGTFSSDEDDSSDFNLEYGGAEAAGRFVWRRNVEWLGFKNIRAVHIYVSLSGGEKPLAVVDFLVRKGGP